MQSCDAVTSLLGQPLRAHLVYLVVLHAVVLSAVVLNQVVTKYLPLEPNVGFNARLEQGSNHTVHSSRSVSAFD